MVKNLEVFSECLMMLRKCKEGVRREDQGWCLVGHRADWESTLGQELSDLGELEESR